MANLLKESLFKETYRCERLAFKAQMEYEDCFNKYKIKCIVDDEVKNEKKENLIRCETALDTLLNFISKNGLSDEYEKFKIKCPSEGHLH